MRGVAGRDGQNTRAGIPGDAGRLGVPARTTNFWKRAVFFPRVSSLKKIGVFFFVAFLGCFCAFWGVLLRFFFLSFFLSFRASARFFFGVNFLKAYHTKTGNSRSGEVVARFSEGEGGGGEVPVRF